MKSLSGFGIRRLVRIHMMNYTLKIAYAHDQAQYAVASDEEACDHYGETQSRVWRVRCYIAGFTKGITAQVPEWFIIRWFNNVVSRQSKYKRVYCQKK